MEENKILEKISIIIPICSSLDCLKETIFYVINLNYPNFEVIIVDNGNVSTNSYPDYFKNKKIRYIKSVPYSKTIAVNNAVKIAKGNFLLFLDSDALINDSNMLSKLFYEIKKDDQVCFSIMFKSADNKYEGLGGKLLIPSRKIKNIFFKNKGEKEQLDYPQGFSFFLKKDVWEKIGGYDEKIPFGCEEIDIGFKLKLHKIGCRLFKETNLVDLGIPQGQIKSIFNDYISSPKKFGLMIYGKGYFLKKYYSMFDFILVIFALFFLHLFLSIKKAAVNKDIDYITQFVKSYYKLAFKD